MIRNVAKQPLQPKIRETQDGDTLAKQYQKILDICIWELPVLSTAHEAMIQIQTAKAA